MQISTGICRWLFFLFFFSWTTLSDSKDLRVVCYYTNWSVYRPGTAKFNPQNINPYLCTHLIYAFGGFTKENTLKPFDKYQDIEKGGYAKFTGLKTYNKNLKTLLAIGGWNEASSRFSPMVASAERRKQLVKNAIKFLRQNHFDGLDLDWEYPAFREGGKPRDRDNYAKLVQELREEFDRESEKTGRPRLLLTMAVPAGIEYINKGYDIPKLTKYLDWMNILSYDYHSAFEPAVNHHAPLYSLEEDSEYNYDAELNIDYTIKHYLELGADPSKLVMGIPTYGRSYTLFNPDANSMGSPADGPGDMGEATRENGYLAYYEICENVKSNGWEVVQPNEKAMGPYAFKENQWVGYDDESIVKKKAEYVAKNGLGGIMFWAIDNDDFRGTCHGRPYPLIEAAKEALISAYGLTDENSVVPNIKPSKPKTRTETSTTDSRKTSGAARRRNRLKSKNKEENKVDSGSSKARRKDAKKSETSTYSSLKIVTPSYTTPEPPSTPDQGGAFKCEEEGFHPHPKDCKKYFWCLSGPGESGIVAHQFTCPAGLYFNKAADSCDYTQNVLCNKKLSKTTTTTTARTTTEKETTTKIVSTRASTRSTTTTTEEPDYEEYEYEDDVKNTDAEEDPKVIKELLELIKKAGGIQELEKQLKHYDDKESTRTKSLVERFLSKNVKPTGKTQYTSINRNSRGPQNEGLETSKEATKEKTKPQYTNILRRGSSTTRPKVEEDETNVEEKIVLKRPATQKAEYVNIRRNRVSTTEKDETVVLNRNKILGEDDDQKESEDSNKKEVSSKPQYVNIRRPRPSTSTELAEEGTSPRSTTIANDFTATTPKYAFIRRGINITEKPTKTTDYLSIQENSKPQETRNDVVEINTARYTTFVRQTTPLSNVLDEEPVTNQESEPITEELPETTLSNSISSTSRSYSVSEKVHETSKTTPRLQDPRPFAPPSEPSTPRSVRFTSKPNKVRTTTSRYRKGTKRTKAPKSTIKFAVTSRHSYTANRRKTTTGNPTFRTKAAAPPSTTSNYVESQDILTSTSRTTKPRIRLTTRRKPPLHSIDQSQAPTNQKKIENYKNSTELTHLALAIHELQQAPLPSSPRPTPHPSFSAFSQGPTTVRYISSTIALPKSTNRFAIYQPSTQIYKATTTKPPPLKLSHYRNVNDYDYYDVGTSYIGQLPKSSKVLIHPDGAIECLDQGNFPHPISCKKFISCAKMQAKGKVVGWEYTCPSNLSFDPIGGICNWSAGLGCNERF